MHLISVWNIEVSFVEFSIPIKFHSEYSQVAIHHFSQIPLLRKEIS